MNKVQRVLLYIYQNPVTLLFGVELRSEADLEYPLDSGEKYDEYWKCDKKI